jgi:hypothetical protein
MMRAQRQSISAVAAERLAEGAADRSPVLGSVHSFYRYPARFSPRFAAAAIDALSAPGDMVLDPYMGGGTTVVEALRAGRRIVGNDLNALAVFVARVKTTRLSDAEVAAVEAWSGRTVGQMGYRLARQAVASMLDDRRLKNMDLPRARFIKKIVAGAIKAVGELPTQASQDFARCAILRTAQWALDGRETHTSLGEFREKLAWHLTEMLRTSADFWQEPNLANGLRGDACTLCQGDAAGLAEAPVFANPESKASLVVTSPPYPGVHVLYHRWQVDGRRETPAPYWIANCNDGQGASFYNFGDRHEEDLTTYFESSLRTLRSIRRAMKDGAYIVQMVAFSDPDTQLPRYLDNMQDAGFVEAIATHQRAANGADRIWRTVPGRRWYAVLKGDIAASREVVLVHRVAD